MAATNTNNAELPVHLPDLAPQGSAHSTGTGFDSTVPTILGLYHESREQEPPNPQSVHNGPLSDDCVRDADSDRGDDTSRGELEDFFLNIRSSIGFPEEKTVSELFGTTLALSLMLFVVLLCIVLFRFTRVIFSGSWDGQYRLFILQFLAARFLLTNLGTGGLNLLPLLAFFVILTNKHKMRAYIFWTSIASLAVVFGLLVWAYYEIGVKLHEDPNSPYFHDPYNVNEISAWRMVDWPQSYKGCEDRVEPEQSPLFTWEVYKTQFCRVNPVSANGSSERKIWELEPFLEVQTNQTLCHQGFAANEDLYGLGIRTGIYLQWLTALLVNNLLPEGHKQAQGVYLIFSTSLCIATCVLSFPGESCTFGIEIEVLYWLYWGGIFAVFVSSPSQTRLHTKKPKWIGLDWVTAIQYTTNILMIYHGLWFVQHAYDQVFARMPCGTYQFFVVPVLDPSLTFGFLRDYLTQLVTPLALLLVMAIPTVTLLLTAEITDSIRASALSQMLFPKWSQTITQNDSQSDISPQATHPKNRITALLLAPFRWFRRWSLRQYHNFRENHFLPLKGRSGIRLITPIDVKDRRNYRIRCVVLGVVSCAVSIAAIEALLSWNNVANIYNIRSTGQYIALTIGLAGLTQACWQLVHQEARRRRDLARREMAGQDIELEEFPATLSGALRSAFARPDIGFLTNDGALPPPTRASRTSLSSLYSVESTNRRFSIGSLASESSLDVSHARPVNDEYMMSGAV